MSTAERPGLYPGQNIFEEKEPKKLRWEEYPGHWRAVVFNTRKEHICAKCGGTLPVDSKVSVTLDFEGLRPKPEDFKSKIQYWHPNARCPEPPIEDEPSN